MNKLLRPLIFTLALSSCFSPNTEQRGSTENLTSDTSTFVQHIINPTSLESEKVIITSPKNTLYGEMNETAIIKKANSLIMAKINELVECGLIHKQEEELFIAENDTAEIQHFFYGNNNGNINLQVEIDEVGHPTYCACNDDELLKIFDELKGRRGNVLVDAEEGLANIANCINTMPNCPN